MAATLLAFSANVLFGIEIVAGKPLPESEQRDFLALWRYLGWLLGVDTVEAEQDCLRSSNASKRNPLVPIDPCGPRKLDKVDGHCGLDGSPEVEHVDDDPLKDSIIHSYASLESMILHLLHPDPSSCEVVKHLLGLGRGSIFRSEMCRKFLGDPLSDELRIAKSSLNWKGWRKESLLNFARHIGVTFSVYFFLLILRLYTLLTMNYPWVRTRAASWHASLEKNYLRSWEQGHAKRMTVAAPGQQRAEISNPPVKNAFCPFSMVMDPQSF